jgi:thiol-disulfide isomerase/thioredoxin
MSTRTPIDLVLYSRPGCHLCDDMLAVVESLAGEFPLRVRTVDVSRDPALEARYGTEIPVLLVDGAEAFRGRLGAAALRARLRAVRR